jgi:prepilin-type N-terminal cleavage/methylation domain-containing protein
MIMTSCLNNKPGYKSYSGFTLIEVIISLGVFGLIVGGLFTLLPWGVDKVNYIKDRNTALGMVDAIQVELERVGFSLVEHGTKRLNNLYSIDNEPEDIINGKVRRLILVAPKNGRKVSFEKVSLVEQTFTDGKLELIYESLGADELLNDTTIHGGIIEFQKASLNDSSGDFDRKSARWIEQRDRYFAIICSQFAKFPHGDSFPASVHYHHPSNGYLALEVEIQWPYKVFDPSEVEEFSEIDEKYRSKIIIPMAIAR